MVQVLRFLVMRILAALPILFTLSVVTFAIIQAPPGDYGDYIRSMLINQGGATADEAEAQANAYREANGLNDPLPIQYLNWMGGTRSTTTSRLAMWLRSVCRAPFSWH